MRRHILLAVGLATAIAAVAFLTRTAGPREIAVAAQSEGRERAPEDPALVSPAGTSTEPAAERTAQVMDVEPEADEEAAFEPAEGEALILVHVTTSERGEPLENARVTLAPRPLPGGHWSNLYIDASDAVPGQAPLTGEDGRVRFRVPAGQAYDLGVTGPEPAEATRRGDVPPLEAGARHEIALAIATESDLPFFGRVVADEDGSPIAGASVHLGAWAPTEFERMFGGKWEDRDPLALVITDHRGEFRLMGRSWTALPARVDAPGRAPATLSLNAGHGVPDEAMEIRLTRDTTLTVRVLRADRTAIVGAEVKLRAEGWSLRRRAQDFATAFLSAEVPGVEWSGTTDAKGLWRTAGLPVNVQLGVDITPPPPNLPANSAVTLALGEERELVVQLGGAEIHGVVLDPSGEPIGAGTVCLIPALLRPGLNGEVLSEPEVFGSWMDDYVQRSTTTDVEGRFAFAEVKPGKWWVGLMPAKADFGKDHAGGVLSLPEAVELVAGQTRADVVLRCQAALQIAGRVVGPNGEAVPGSYVGARQVKSLNSIRAKSGSDGRFAVGPLLPGQCVISAEGTGGFVTSDPLEIAAGATDVELRLHGGGVISGVLIDRASGSPCGGTVSLRATGETRLLHSFFARWSASVRDDGEFQCEALAPGAYDLVATADGQRIAVRAGLVVAAGTRIEGFRVALALGGVIVVRDGANRSDSLIRVTHEGALVAGVGVVLQQGSTFLAPAGTALVELLDKDGATVDKRTVEVLAGETQDVVFE